MPQQQVEIRLEALPGGPALPSNLYAAVGNPGGLLSLAPCLPGRISTVGLVPKGAPACVEFFLRVGSVALAGAEAGQDREHEICLEGVLEKLGLRLSAVAAAEDAPPLSPTTLPITPPSPCVAFEDRASPVSPPASRRKYSVFGDATPRGSQPPRQSQRGPSSPKSREWGQAIVRIGGDGMGKAMSVRPAQPSGSPTAKEEPETSKQRGSTGVPRLINIGNADQILPHLYLGDIQAASQTSVLVDQGIRAVVCCCREMEFPDSDFHADLEYYRVDVEDIAREPIDLFFPEATAFIHSWISREQPVLVHCRAGVSRSASVVIAYLIEYHKYCLRDAFFMSRTKRSIVTPNIGFMEKLCAYEEAKRATETTVDIDKYCSWFQNMDGVAVPDLSPD